jgi:ATP-dependent RNA helicase RhlE
LQFTDFRLHQSILDGIAAMSYDRPTPIQEQVIPVILDKKDLIASAQTGTGKTAAFLLPVFDHLISYGLHHLTRTLILVPTRELAKQIEQNIEGMSYFTDISSMAIYGGSDGQNFIKEKEGLKKGVDIIVCTPGRLIAHINMGNVDFSHIQHFILDEADRMLDMGFQDDINKIFKALPEKKQTLMFSATMPDKIRSLARKLLVQPVEINVALSKPPDRIKQFAFAIYETEKAELLKYHLKNIPYMSAIVFCSSKDAVKMLQRRMKSNGINSEEIHSDLEQSKREQVLLSYINKQVPVLIATDIMSRGIDIETIDLVVNYDVPHDSEDYVHRIGRTARAESEGTAITYVMEKDMRRFLSMERNLGINIEKPEPPSFIKHALKFEMPSYRHQSNIKRAPQTRNKPFTKHRPKNTN